MLVQASVGNNQSIAGQPLAVITLSQGQSNGVPGWSLSTGTFNINDQLTNAIHPAANVSLVGGGSSGTRGADRIFGAWVQNSTQLDEGASYQNNHAIPLLLASNVNQATGSFGMVPMFIPGNPAPAILNLPMLDTGSPNPGSGNYSSALRVSQITSASPVPPQLGVQMLVEAADSPGFSAPTVTPADGVSQMTQIHLNQGFNDFLTLWANTTGNNTQTPVKVAAPAGYGTAGGWARIR